MKESQRDREGAGCMTRRVPAAEQAVLWHNSIRDGREPSPVGDSQQSHRDGRIVQLRLMIGDAPGQLARVATVIGRLGGNIVEVQHQRLFGVVAKATELDVTVETRDRAHAETVLRALADDGFAPAPIEMAAALE